MRLNKRTQYGLLLVIYLCRSGRANLSTIAETLNLSLAYLRKVATDLVAGRILTVTRGPTGGYELSGDPSVRDVFSALKPVMLLSGRETSTYGRGCSEYRALSHFVLKMRECQEPMMRTKVRLLNHSLVTKELAQLESAQSFARQDQ